MDKLSSAKSQTQAKLLFGIKARVGFKAWPSMVLLGFGAASSSSLEMGGGKRFGFL